MGKIHAYMKKYLYFTPNHFHFITCPADCGLTWKASEGPAAKGRVKNNQNYGLKVK